MTELFGLEMAGKSVLDIGGHRGDKASHALTAGAAQATVLDNGEWQQYGWQPFEPLEGVRYEHGDFLEAGEPADIVFCLNVIYHLQEPLAGIRRLRKLTREWLVIRSSFVPGDEPGLGIGGWKNYPAGSGHENGTVWVRPTQSSLRQALHEAGFLVVREWEVVKGSDDYQGSDEVTYVCQ